MPETPIITLTFLTDDLNIHYKFLVDALLIELQLMKISTTVPYKIISKNYGKRKHISDEMY